MKLIPLLFLFITFDLMACPVLEGKFLCKNTKGTYEKTFKMTEKGILVGKKEYKTDGSIEALPDTSDRIQNRTIRAYCQNDRFFVDYEADIYHADNYLGHQFSKSTYYKVGNNINLEVEVTFRGQSFPPFQDFCSPL